MKIAQKENERYVPPMMKMISVSTHSNILNVSFWDETDPVNGGDMNEGIW
ncbi:MAG: hypothetical protein MJZ17_00190 [Bacteroidales bacterium]|nr:hypothetical protein [Bacteroidales bacterium]